MNFAAWHRPICFSLLASVALSLSACSAASAPPAGAVSSAFLDSAYSNFMQAVRATNLLALRQTPTMSYYEDMLAAVSDAPVLTPEGTMLAQGLHTKLAAQRAAFITLAEQSPSLGALIDAGLAQVPLGLSRAEFAARLQASDAAGLGLVTTKQETISEPDPHGVVTRTFYEDGKLFLRCEDDGKNILAGDKDQHIPEAVQITTRSFMYQPGFYVLDSRAGEVEKAHPGTKYTPVSADMMALVTTMPVIKWSGYGMPGFNTTSSSFDPSVLCAED